MTARLACALLLVGCGLYDGGAEKTEPMLDATTGDVVRDASSDPVVLPDTGPNCDAGGVSILVLAGASDCPVGTMREDLVSNPAPTVGACTCGMCNIATQPACSGAFQGSWGDTNTCSSGVWNLMGSNCGAFPMTFTAVAYNRMSTLNPSGGTCTAAAMPDPSKVQTTPVVRCLIPQNKPEIACGAQQAGGYKMCIAASMCSGEFSQPIVAGTMPTVTCAACSCSVSAAGCSIDYHGNAQCNDMVKMTRAMDNTCAVTNMATNVSHYRTYATGVTCGAVAGMPTVGLAGPTTLCCKP